MLRNEEINQNDDEIILLDGSRGIIDFREFYEIVDILAFNYGIGACKSLTEFAEIINNEDPVLLNGLKKAIIKRVIIMNGGKVEDEPTTYRVVEKSGKSRIVNDEKNKLVMFLTSFGADKKEIDEALIKINSGKIKIPERDYNWITDEVLCSKDFDLKGVMAQMREDENNSINIKVSAETRLKALKG